MAFTTTRSCVCVTVTLATHDQKYNLKALVDAVLAAESGGDTAVVCPGAPRSYSIQSYPGIDGTGVNTKDILLGDSKLSTTRIGKVLAAAGGIYEDRSTVGDTQFGSLYAQSSSDNQKLNIIVSAA